MSEAKKDVPNVIRLRVGSVSSWLEFDVKVSLHTLGCWIVSVDEFGLEKFRPKLRHPLSLHTVWSMDGWIVGRSR